MRQRSETWVKLAARGRFTLDVVAVIGGVTYTAISAPVIDRALLSDAMSIGNCIAASMKVSVLTDDEISTAASVVIKARITDGTTVSEWLEFGTFYIDKREKNNELITLQCFDAMLKASQRYVDPSKSDDRIGWPKSMQTCVTEIAHRIGVEIDPRTVISTAEAYQVAYPTNYTMQQVLEFIGAAHGGNWIITPENKLRLVPLISPPVETFDIIDYYYNKIHTDDGYKLVWQHRETDEPVENGAGGDIVNVPVVIGRITTGKSMIISRVTIAQDDKLGYTNGDDTGVELRNSNNPCANQAVCDDLYAALNGTVYAPFAITNACYDPCAELGDWVLVGDQVRSVLYKQTLTFSTDFRADASAPGKDETGSEYPYLTEIEKLHLEDESLKAYMDEAKKEVDSQILQTREAITLEVTARQQLAETVNALDTRISLTEGNITAEVTRATNAETELASRITVTEGSITAEVTRAEDAETSLSSRISITENNITLKVSKGDVSSQISVETGTVTIGSNRLIVESDNFNLNRSGEISASGSFTTESAYRKATLSSGGLSVYCDDSLSGSFRGDTEATRYESSSRSYNVLKIGVETNALIIASGGNYSFAYNNGLNPNGYTERIWFGADVRMQNTLYAAYIELDDGYINSFNTASNAGLYVGGDLYASGDLWCGGTKNRAVSTTNYGVVGLNSMESTVAVFSDIGSATLDVNGVAFIFFEPDFFETIDTSHDYQAFITPTSEGVIQRVEKANAFFTVYGEPNTSFDWVVYARQKGYVNHRMESVAIEPHKREPSVDSVFYGDDIPASQSEALMDEFPDNLDDLAEEYLKNYEQEVTNYDN